MKNGGRKCIRKGFLIRRVGLALSDTLSIPTDRQKNGGKIEPKNGEIFWYENGDNFRTSITNLTTLSQRESDRQLNEDLNLSQGHD